MITMMMILLPRKPLFPGQYEVDQLGKIFEASFFLVVFSSFCFWTFPPQVIGTPVEADWPEESSVLRSNFSYARGRGVTGILAELDPQVWVTYINFYSDANSWDQMR